MKAASVRALVVGAGGLGCPASLALAYAGVGALTVVDPDQVDLSNLHRQPWHRTGDVGRPKVESAAERLRAAFPRTVVETHRERITGENAGRFFAGHDLVIDGTDDWRIKLALSDVAVRTGPVLVYGGVLRLTGQAMVISPRGPCLRCLFEEPEELPTCARAGVLGSVAGAVGALQALLGLRALAEGAPRPTRLARIGQLFVLDGASLTQRIVAVPVAEDCIHG